jgi:hypothetical protein
MRWRDDWWLLTLAALLLLGMLATLFHGSKPSRHGYGRLAPANRPGQGAPLRTGNLRSDQSRIPPTRS